MFHFFTYLKGPLSREANQYLQCVSATENLKVYPLFKGRHTSNSLYHHPGPGDIVPISGCFIQELNYWSSSSLNFLVNIWGHTLKVYILNKSEITRRESFIIVFWKVLIFLKWMVRNHNNNDQITLNEKLPLFLIACKNANCIGLLVMLKNCEP